MTLSLTQLLSNLAVVGSRRKRLQGRAGDAASLITIDIATQKKEKREGQGSASGGGGGGEGGGSRAQSWGGGWREDPCSLFN